MSTRKRLVTLAAIVSTEFISLQSQEPVHASGMVLAAPVLFDIKSFAHIQLYVDHDTIGLYTGPTGTARYDFAIDSMRGDTTLTILVYVQPGYVYQDCGRTFMAGDQFNPYHSLLSLSPGNNQLHILENYDDATQPILLDDKQILRVE